MRFWQSWDEEERAAAVRIAGLCVAALTLFIFISTFSYLFHWREDMSLLGDPDAMQAGRAVGNAAGKLGFRMGHLLVCELFGLGSFSLLIILTAMSVRLLAHRWSKSLLKTALIAIFGAFISSVVLAYAGKLAGQELNKFLRRVCKTPASLPKALTSQLFLPKFSSVLGSLLT